MLVIGRGLPAQVQHSEFQASRGFKTKTKIKKTKTNNRLKKKKQELYQEKSNQTLLLLASPLTPTGDLVWPIPQTTVHNTLEGHGGPLNAEIKKIFLSPG